jgi:hypothetical protein
MRALGEVEDEVVGVGAQQGSVVAGVQLGDIAGELQEEDAR